MITQKLTQVNELGIEKPQFFKVVQGAATEGVKAFLKKEIHFNGTQGCEYVVIYECSKCEGLGVEKTVNIYPENLPLQNLEPMFCCECNETTKIKIAAVYQKVEVPEENIELESRKALIPAINKCRIRHGMKSMTEEQESLWLKHGSKVMGV